MRRLFFLIGLAMAIPATLDGGCGYEQVLAPFEVCTEWWDGTSSCHVQLGWFEAYVCRWSIGPISGGGGTSGGGGGGSQPPDDKPPTLQLTEISDENPNQLVLHLIENDAVVETTLAIDGNVIATTGRTDVLFLPSLKSMSGDTVITVQARNATYTYATALCHARREVRGPYTATANVYAQWTFLQVDRDPAPSNGEWTRTVHLGVTHTSYDVQTFGYRNGEYEHTFVEDQLAGKSELTPIPAWETKYTIETPQLNGFFYGWKCDIWPIAPAPFSRTTICTEPDEFTRAGLPAGTASILDFNVPYSWSTALYDGRDVVVSP